MGPNPTLNSSFRETDRGLHGRGPDLNLNLCVAKRAQIHGAETYIRTDWVI